LQEDGKIIGLHGITGISGFLIPLKSTKTKIEKRLRDIYVPSGALEVTKFLSEPL
jgi:hypothetical protein